MSSSNWDDPVKVLERAQSARVQGDRALAYQLYARASELNPQEAEAWRGRAEMADSPDEALVSYAYAASLDPGNEPLAHELDAALAERVQDSERGDVPLLVALGQEFAEVGQTDRAQTLLERAVELDPSSTDALVWLAGISPEDQARLDLLNRALETNPRDPRARAGLHSVKLPPPPAPLPAASSEDTPSAAPTATLIPPTDQSDDMDRLRKLRANVPPKSSAPVVPSSLQPSAVSEEGADSRLRTLLLILIALVLVLAVAGVILLLFQ